MKSQKFGMLLSFVGILLAYWCPAQLLSYVYNVESQKMDWPVFLVGCVIGLALYLAGSVINILIPNKTTAFGMYVFNWFGFGLVLGAILSVTRGSGSWVFSSGLACAMLGWVMWVIVGWLWPGLNKRADAFTAAIVFSLAAVLINLVVMNLSLAAKLDMFPYPPQSPVTFWSGIMLMLWSTVLLYWFHKRTEKVAPMGPLHAGVAPIRWFPDYQTTIDENEV